MRLASRSSMISPAQSLHAFPSNQPSSGWRQEAGQRQECRRPDIFPTSDPQNSANHTVGEATPKVGRGGGGGKEERCLGSGVCAWPEAGWPGLERGGAESEADSSDRDVSGKRTDTMAALMVLSAQSLAQNRPRGPGL